MGAYGANYGSNYAGFAITELIIAPSTKTVTAVLCVNESIKSDLCVKETSKSNLCTDTSIKKDLCV